MLNIVIPMAGLGSRFREAGYATPKPLIPIHGVPMIEIVLANLRPSCEHSFILICQRAHLDAHGFDARLAAIDPSLRIVALDGLTEGAACTVLAARELIDGGEPLMIANSDQYVDVSIDRYLAELERRELHGLIMTMRAADTKWSFVARDADGYVTRVAEKEPISDEATVGIYNFREGRTFVQAAERMIARQLRVNNEFYVAPVYNQLIEDGARIGSFDVGRVDAGMYGLGIPEDLQRFAALPLSRIAADRARG